MNLSANFYITPKGADELNQRANKLSLKKRSLLIFLNTPSTIQGLLSKSLRQEADVVADLEELLIGGFVSQEGALSAPQAPRKAVASASTLRIEEGSILSEAKFLLKDFCVDYFPDEAERFVDEIGACTHVDQLNRFLEKISAKVGKNQANVLTNLQGVVQSINETA